MSLDVGRRSADAPAFWGLTALVFSSSVVAAGAFALLALGYLQGTLVLVAGAAFSLAVASVYAISILVLKRVIDS